MFEITFIIILFIGLIGMSVMLFLKVPALVNLKLEGPSSIQKIKQKGQGIIKSLSRERLLHKLLSQIRVWTLRTENKVTISLSNLREKSKENKVKFSSDYWKKLKRKK